MTRIKELTINEVEYVAFYLARRWMTFNEPIPDFHTRFPNKLESCLATPFQKFNRQSLYQGLASRGAILFYLLIKNHPFQNLPAPRHNKYSVYVLKCFDSSLYKGFASDLNKRLKDHNKGLVKWTSVRRPIELIYFEEFDNKENAIKREKELKTGFGRKWLKKIASRQAGGNKRIAMTALLTFLYKNNKWLKVDQKEFYNFAMWIAQSPAGANEETVKYTGKFIKKNLVNLN